jgi:hypothetical protein
MKKFLKGIVSAAVCFGLASIAFAAVTVNADGTGFVGKGDVQAACSLNNNQLQAWWPKLESDELGIAITHKTVTEREWTCTNSNNENELVREETTTTKKEGLGTITARTRNQITGFSLTGLNGVVSVKSVAQGGALNSCPQGQDWSLTIPAGDPVLVSETSYITVACPEGDVVVD